MCVYRYSWAAIAIYKTRFDVRHLKIHNTKNFNFISQKINFILQKINFASQKIDFTLKLPQAITVKVKKKLRIYQAKKLIKIKWQWLFLSYDNLQSSYCFLDSIP